jgi:hypothetical protein
MGISRFRPDIQLITDYATNERFLRLHLDVALTAELFDLIRPLLEQKRHKEAEALLTNALPGPKAYYQLFFNPPQE